MFSKRQCVKKESQLLGLRRTKRKSYKMLDVEGRVKGQG